MAMLNTFAGKEPAPVDGLSAEQRFFLGLANVWCENRTDALSRMLVTIDPHSPPKIPRERNHFQYAGVPRSLPLPSNRADGESERVQGVVGKAVVGR